MAHWIGKWLYGVKLGAGEELLGFETREEATARAIDLRGEHYGEQNVTVFAYEGEEGELVSDDGV